MQDLDTSLSGFFPPQRICILGAGHFGYLAAERLIRRYPKTAFLVVDQRREKLDRIEKDFGLAVQVQDTASFLENPWVDDTTWIVPAVPVHFAFLWIENELKKSGRVERLPIPEIMESQVPNPYRAAGGSLWRVLPPSSALIAATNLTNFAPIPRPHGEGIFSRRLRRSLFRDAL